MKTLNDEVEELQRAIGDIYRIDRALFRATPTLAGIGRRSGLRKLLRTHSRQVRSYGDRIRRIAAEIQRKYGELNELACSDPLTGLPNRREVMERLAEEMQRARRHGTSLSVIMLDIDDFKQINDTYGHQAGDRALVDVATGIASAARAYDVAARYGGDEFMIILPGADATTALTVAERIDSASTAHSSLAQKVRVSIGLACLCPETLDESALIEEADRVLYAAKRAKQQLYAHSPASTYLL